MTFPNILQRATSYLESRAIWTAAGKPMRSNERILEIYNNFCKPCEHYKSTGYACDICGCLINTGTLANKICWATTRCPDVEPKWIEEIDISKLEIKEETTIELSQEENELLNTENAIIKYPELLNNTETPQVENVSVSKHNAPPPTVKISGSGGCGCKH